MNCIGLYIHIPFCDGKCAYCNFFSKRANDGAYDKYIDEMINIIRVWSKTVKRDIDTVYFGGGTPSLLGHDRLIRILGCIYDNFSVTDDAEITVEVNPSSTDALDFAAMKSAGFNRLSVGLQSADDTELRLLGRRHSVEDVRLTVSQAKSAGFENISLDVMLAIPGQTIDSLNKTLEFCAGCGVQHISSYILKIEEGTPFYRRRNELQLFSDEDQADMYEYTADKLSRLGYMQYEISNFSVPGYKSRHNLHYWHDEEYLGLGPSAHSFLNGKRFYYDSDFNSFYGDHVLCESDGGDSEEYIMLALRLTEGLDFKKYEQRFLHPVSQSFIEAARKLEKNGLCSVSENNVALTVKGFLVSNSVIAYLSENT